MRPGLSFETVLGTVDTNAMDGRSGTDGVKLNTSKCKEYQLANEDEEIRLLGGYIGPSPAAFLAQRIQEQQDRLPALELLPAQHLWLLLQAGNSNDGSTNPRRHRAHSTGLRAGKTTVALRRVGVALTRGVLFARTSGIG